MTYLALYIITAVLTYGGSFAYWQREYPDFARESYYRNLRFSLFFALAPLAGFLVVLFGTGFYKHGFKFK